MSKISEDPLLAVGEIDPAIMYVPVVDPSEPEPVDRNKRALLGDLVKASGAADLELLIHVGV